MHQFIILLFKINHQIPSEYLSFLEGISNLQSVKPLTLSQKNKNYQQHDAKVQYQYEPKPNKEIIYVTEKEYAQLIENEQESKTLLKKPQQQIHQQNRFKQQQTRFNQNLRQKEQLEQVLLQSPKQIISPFQGSSFEKELKRLESLNRPIHKHIFNSNAQQSAYNTRQDEIYKDDVDSIKTTTETQKENKKHSSSINVHRELENSKLPFLDKDRVFSQSEFQAFLDAGYSGNKKHQKYSL